MHTYSVTYTIYLLLALRQLKRPTSGINLGHGFDSDEEGGGWGWLFLIVSTS